MKAPQRTKEPQTAQQLSPAKEKEYPAIVSLHCERHKITAALSDGRITSIPTAWFKRLRQAKLEQLQKFEIAFDGYDIHWPEIDEDISVKAFVEGLNNN